MEIMAGTNHCNTSLVRLPDEGRKSFSIREELDVKQIGTAADTDRAAEISVLLPRQGGFSALCFGAEGHEQELFAQRCSQTGQHPLPCGSIQSIRKPVGPPLDAVGLQRGQPPGLTENIVLCAGDDGQDDFGRPAPMQQPRMVMLDMITTSLQKRYFIIRPAPPLVKPAGAKIESKPLFVEICTSGMTENRLQ